MEKKSLFGRLFPIEHDFYNMLFHQAKTNALGVGALNSWLESGAEEESGKVIRYVGEADEVRMDMESQLTASFSTPFDRGDIYSISVGMDKIIEYANSTLVSMQQFEVAPDEIIIRMTGKLKEGTDLFAESIGSLKSAPQKAGQNIAGMRETHLWIEQLYRQGMAALFKSQDPMHALKYREVYHHIKDASEKLEEAVDILHRIVVRLT